MRMFCNLEDPSIFYNPQPNSPQLAELERLVGQAFLHSFFRVEGGCVRCEGAERPLGYRTGLEEAVPRGYLRNAHREDPYRAFPLGCSGGNARRWCTGSKELGIRVPSVSWNCHSGVTISEIGGASPSFGSERLHEA
jgi:hypothetical protein